MNQNEKSEAQIRNEEEVHRIIMERGYSSASNNKKQVKKVFGNDFPFGSIISGVIGVAIIIGGWVFLQNYIFDDNGDNNSASEEDTFVENSEELIGFHDCLGKIDTSEIALDDNEFWSKHIIRHEQAIACYGEYPSVASNSEKAELQDELDKLRENSKSAEANDTQYRNRMAEIDAEYNKAIAENQAKYEQNKAKLDAETDALFEKYDRERAERNAQYEKEKAEREAKQAKCNEFKTQYSDLNAYKAKNGNLDELWNAYQDAKAEYSSALNAYGHSNPNHSDEWIEAIWKGVQDKEATMNAAYNAWKSSDLNLSTEYNNKLKEACL